LMLGAIAQGETQIKDCRKTPQHCQLF